MFLIAKSKNKFITRHKALEFVVYIHEIVICSFIGSVGHIYCIADCGGAMIESTCPECKQIIGGKHHKLCDGNAVATEMDGAHVGAWSEQANMANNNLR